jgi:hypothetical protein
MTAERGRPPKAAIAAMVFLLCSAFALGAALDRFMLMREGRLPPVGMPPSPDMMRVDPKMLARIRAMLKRELGVTPAQEPTIDRILSQQISAMDSIRIAVRPRIEEAFVRTKLSLDSVLTVEQRQRRDALLAKLAPFTDSMGVRAPSR